MGWEEVPNHPSDVLLYSLRFSMTPEEIAAQPTAALLPAVQAGQLYPWKYIGHGLRRPGRLHGGAGRLPDRGAEGHLSDASRRGLAAHAQEDERRRGLRQGDGAGAARAVWASTIPVRTTTPPATCQPVSTCSSHSQATIEANTGSIVATRPAAVGRQVPQRGDRQPERHDGAQDDDPRDQQPERQLHRARARPAPARRARRRRTATTAPRRPRRGRRPRSSSR